MILPSYEAIQKFYLNDSQRVLNMKLGPSVLKTDLYNEANGTPIRNGIVGNLIGYKKIHAIEVQPQVVERARVNTRMTDKMFFYCGDIRSLPYADEMFDVILDLSTLDHIRPMDVPKVLLEYNRVLKDKGYFYLITWIDTQVKHDEQEWNANNQYYFNKEALIVQIQFLFNIIEDDHIFTHPGKENYQLIKILCQKI